MNIIFITRSSRSPNRFHIGHRNVVFLMFMLLIFIPSIMMYSGYQFGLVNAENQLLPKDWQEEMTSNRDEITELSKVARENMSALTLRLGKIQAQAVRLNALGERLVEAGKLDKDEFDFSSPPALGGPRSDSNVNNKNLPTPDFLQSLDKLAVYLGDRERQLQVMESFFMSRDLDEKVIPSGRPIKKGWLSSYYGLRTDPFTGFQEHHNGVDFAGKEGSEIITIASGVVTWSGKRYGYGTMVEINHGNGYVSRYAHNKKNVVKIGDTVMKGTTIALMGSSGRSTGPHVHLEILLNGRSQDPAKFVYASR